jgi:hypothetical protein
VSAVSLGLLLAASLCAYHLVAELSLLRSTLATAPHHTHTHPESAAAQNEGGGDSLYTLALAVRFYLQPPASCKLRVVSTVLDVALSRQEIGRLSGWSEADIIASVQVCPPCPLARAACLASDPVNRRAHQTSRAVCCRYTIRVGTFLDSD